MLIAEKLQAGVGFTTTDEAIAAIILEAPDEVPALSIQSLAKRAHSSHSAVIRLCKRMGFHGYREFVIALVQELSKPQTLVEDSNFPFAARDTLRDATKKLGSLSVAAITNTKQRLNMPALVGAVQYLLHARRIFLYGHGDSNLAVQRFASKLNKIDVYPVLADMLGESSWNSTNVTDIDCVLIVSYRGQYRTYEQVLRYMKENQVPTILVTGRPESVMASLATVCLDVSGDEYDFMKMGTIASQVSIDYLLTVLFSGIYAHNYQQNFAALKARQENLTTGLLAEDGSGVLDEGTKKH